MAVHSLHLVAAEPAPAPLSPMQSGMLFESLASGQGAGFDVEQLHVVLSEAIDAGAMAGAWTLVAGRHEALTACFEWEGCGRPRQRFSPGVVVPVEREDFRGLGDGEAAERRAELLARDRARGFDLRAAPLMRVTLVEVDGGTELLWTFHHIVIDGRSIPAVLAEVFVAYDALRRGRTPEAPPPARAYRDYLDWLEGRDLAPSRAYFRDLLAGKRTPTPLPLAEPAARPLPGRGCGDATLSLDEETLRAARALASRTRTSLATVVYAAWALVLARTTGDDDVVFGATRACRRSVPGGAEDTVGLFINSPPVRVAAGDERTVGELLASVRAQILAARDHEHTPLVEVQAASELPRGAPLFETLVLFDARELNAALRATGDARWSRTRARLHEQPSPPLTLTAMETTGLDLRLLYDRRRYRDEVAERILGYVAAAIAELGLGEERTLGELDVLPPQERRRIVREWNTTARPFPDQDLIHRGFEAQARRQPDAIAVECEGAQLTYAELDARANRLARALVARGARPRAYVGLCLRRGIDLVVALLAVAKSGAAYVPLDADYPRERLAFMVSDAQALFVVTERALEERFDGPTLAIDGDDAAAIAALPPTPPPNEASPTDDCYAIFTSGSTGRPKGVVLTHRAVVNTFDWVTRTLEVAPGDRLLFVTSPCFDLSVYDTFGALGAGATVVVATREDLGDPEALARAIVDRRITVWDSAPAALQRLAPFFPAEPEASRLRLVMLSGDWIPLGLPDAVRAAFPGARVVSLGGATEAAIWSNWFPIGPLDPRWTSIPYGRPIQNARYHVLDAQMRPVPIGVAGDLYIGGACLARGYLNRPELTAERFVRDPFTAEEGERLYKTGDLARYFDDGNLEFLGRADFQVKIRGYRVELGEVEAALLGIAGVREAVCTARADASGQRSLVAYLVAQPGVSLAPDAVKAAVASRLADFMVPSQIVVLGAMPLSSNGKVDRKALPDPTARAGADLAVAPRTAEEKALAAIWRELLRCETVGVTDDFFALGGHSLLAVMLVSRIGRDLGIKVPVSRVLEHRTIRALAASLGQGEPRLISGCHVITLSREAPRPPLFLVSGSGGFGFVFRETTDLLADRHPVHILNAIGAESEDEGIHHTIEEMASIYLPEIEEAAPLGPVILGGYSFGMLVAFELAHRLRQRGREVPLLVSFDGFAPRFPELLSLPARMVVHARTLLTTDGEARRTYARDRWNNLRRHLRELLGREVEASERCIVPGDAQADLRLRRLEASLWRARGAYAPAHKAPSDMLLVKTALSEHWPGAKMDDPLYGWGRYIEGRVDVATVPGAHLTLFEDGNQRRMAEAILEKTARFERGAA